MSERCKCGTDALGGCRLHNAHAARRLQQDQDKARAEVERLRGLIFTTAEAADDYISGSTSGLALALAAQSARASASTATENPKEDR